MTSEFEILPLTGKEIADYGHARVRDKAFDAVRVLWKRRKSEGITQAKLCDALGRNPAWVSRNLRGPGNWTLKTLGALAEALGGEVEIQVLAKEDRRADRANYNAYDDLSLEHEFPANIRSSIVRIDDEETIKIR